MMNSSSVTTSLNTFAVGAVSLLTGVPTTWDAIILFLIFGLLFFYGVSFGLRRLYQLMMSTYITFAIFSISPFLDEFLSKNKLSNGSAKSFLFVITVMAIAFFFSFRRPRGLVRSWFKTAVFAVVATALFTTFCISLLPQATFKTISPFVKSLFTGDLMVVFWTLLPLVVFFLWQEE